MARERNVSHGVTSDSGSATAESQESGHTVPFRSSPLIEFLWRRRAFILVGTLLCGITALIVSLLIPPAYETEAVLIVQPSPVSSALDPAPLGVEAYRLLLESDFVIDQTLQRLVSESLFPPGTPPETLRKMLTVVTYEDRRNVPLLALRTRSPSAKAATAAANLWAQAAVEHFARLTQESQQGTGGILQAQYPIIRDKLSATRASLKQRQDFFADALLEIEKRWSPNLVEFDRETGRLTREHEKQTDSLRIEFESKWEIPFSKQRLQGLEDTLLNLETQVTESRAEIAVQEKLLAGIKEEIQNEPKFWVVSKAITDEALWAKIGNPDSELPSELDQLKLRSEFLNPAHQQLLERMTESQLEYDLLSRRLSELPKEIEQLASRSEGLRKWINVKETGLNALLSDRAADLDSLLDDREAQKRILEKSRDEETARIQRERDFEVGQLESEVEDLQGVYAAVAPKYQEAQLAQFRNVPAVRIAAPAIAPQRATRPSTLLNAFTASVIGLILSILVALLVEYVRHDFGLKGQSS